MKHKGEQNNQEKRRNLLLLLFLNHFWSGGPSSLMMNEVDLADTHTNTHTPIAFPKCFSMADFQFQLQSTVFCTKRDVNNSF